MWDTVLAMLSVLCVCVFLTLKTKIPAGFTPLVALCGAALWFSVVGMLGVLWAGGLLWYLLSATVLVLALLPVGGQRLAIRLRALLTPGFLLFVAVGLCAIGYLAIRQPLLHEWDEYSLWGTIVKIMKLNNQLYTTAPSGFAWPSTQTPTLPMLGYFMQFFGGFAVWKIYAAYTLLMLAVVCALVGVVPLRQYQLAVPLGIVGLLVPWFFSIYNRQYEAKLVWLSAYGDIPAGMLFGGALVLYFGLRKQRVPLWPVVPVLAALALVKDNTFVFALAAAGMMSLDLLLIKQEGEGKLSSALGDKTRFPRLRHHEGGQGSPSLAGRLGLAAVYLASALVPYMVWGRHIAAVVAARQSSGAVDPSSASPALALVTGTKMLLGVEPRSEWFTQTWNAMWQAFFYNTTNGVDPTTGQEVTHKILGGAPISMLGGGLLVVCLILLLFLAAILLAQNKTLRRRALLSLGGSLLCFVGYSYQIFISFVFVFGEGQGLLPSYNRYMYGYYMGWFLLAVCLVGQAAAGRLSKRPPAKNTIKTGFAQGLILVLAGVMLLRTPMLLPLQNSDVGYPSAAFNTQRAEADFAAVIAATLGETPQRIFFVSQGDSEGKTWFLYHYLLLPHIVDYSGVPTKVGGAGGGGGSYSSPALLKGDNPAAFNTYTPEQIQAYITEAGIGYLLIETLDERFIESYKLLFEDHLRQAAAGHTLLYKVQGKGRNLRFVPVQMEVPQR